MKQSRKGMLMAALICGTITSVLGGASVFAAEKDEKAADEALQAFELNPMVITATRTEKNDLDVPASTEILTHEQIKMSGATNALEAVQKMNGVEAKQMFAGGAAMTSMIPEINIRGFGNGTLVMVNGNPINLNTKYFIDSIPTEYIEKIEVVKGGGTVLYGSEAMGGVVNIITKKTFNNYATVGIGNHGQRKYAVGVGNDKFHINYDEKRWGHLNHVTDSHNPHKKGGYYYNQDRNVKRNLGLGINFTKELDFQYNHFETHVDYHRNHQITNDCYEWRNTHTKQDLFQLNYNAKDWKGHIYYHKNKIKYYGGEPGVYDSKTLNENVYSALGMDLQKDFHVNDKTLITTGFNYKHEDYKPKLSKGKSTEAAGLENHKRDILSAYAQIDHKFTPKDNLIVGGRGTWVTSDKNGNKYHNFSASGQYLHKFDDNQSAYISVAQSFIMPSWSQMFPSGTMAGDPNPDLKPQKGINYEIGYKAIAGNHSYKLALFHMKVDDNITATWKNHIYTYKNEDFKNTGFEASMNVAASDKLDYNIGFTIQNPKNKVSNSKDKVGWQRKFGAYQVTAGINYKLNKFKFGLRGSYVWDRYSSPSSSDSYKIKPYFLTTFTTVYTPDKNNEFALIVDNVLNRKDYLSNTMSNHGTYYSTPTNFLFTYTYKF